MSEESTHESDDGPVVHKKPPSFRSSSELVYLQSLLFYECVCVCVCVHRLCCLLLAHFSSSEMCVCVQRLCYLLSAHL